MQKIKKHHNNINFTLNNAISKFQNIIVKQQKGIPQGDSLSPAIAIGTCAHQEIKWKIETPNRISSAIYLLRCMDDVLCIVDTTNPHWLQAVHSYKIPVIQRSWSLQKMTMNISYNVRYPHQKVV